MQFRLGKSWFSIGFSALLLFFASSPNAFAIIVTLASSGDGLFSPNFYFPATPVTDTEYSGYTPIDLTQTDSNPASNIVLSVTTTVVSPTPTPVTLGGTQNVLMVTMTGSISTFAIPIVGYGIGGVGGCNGGVCTFLGTYNNNTYYHGVYVTSQNFDISLNIAAMCNAFNFYNIGSYGNGCDTNLLGTNTGKNPTVTKTGWTSIPLTIGVYSMTVNAVQTAANPPVPSPYPAPIDSAQIVLNFSTNGAGTGKLTCNLPAAYYPGDGQILVDGTQFGLSAATTAAGAPDGLGGVLVAAKDEGSGPFTPITPSAATVNSSGYNPFQSINILSGQGVGGFQNSTPPNNLVEYAVGFIGEDFYGFLVDNTTAGACAFQHPVETAQIQGFLQENKCFIASAAFRSDSSALRLLRRFRDVFLERFGLGRFFVHWYYAWSPDAAEWLLDHPEFRYPVLLGLIPLQIAAWLILHPGLLCALFFAAISLLLYSFTRSETQEERSG